MTPDEIDDWMAFLHGPGWGSPLTFPQWRWQRRHGPVPALRARGAMGTHLIQTAFGVPGLSDRAKLVLLCMGFHALDRPKGDLVERLYWGGWELLAREALGFTDYEKSDTGRRAVARAIKELVAAGCIKVHRKEPGMRTVYQVLPEWPLAADVVGHR